MKFQTNSVVPIRLLLSSAAQSYVAKFIVEIFVSHDLNTPPCFLLSQCAWNNNPPTTYLLWQLQCLVLTDTLFLCNLPDASRTINNIEEISLPLDHTPEQYFSSYFSLLHEVYDDQHGYAHQLGETFKKINNIKCIIWYRKSWGQN